jgi:protein O-mannosyl-transferase
MGRGSRRRRSRGGPDQGLGVEAPSTLRGRRSHLASLVAILALVLAVYGRSVGFDFTHTDDTVLLVDDAHFVADLGNLPRAFTRTFFRSSGRSEAYYRPLVTISFMIDAQWGGTKPAVYHASNLMAHVLACCLLFLLLRELDVGPGLSLLGALIFSVNPAIAEAVYWVPGRCDLLLGIGFLASGLCFLRYLHTGRPLWLVAHLSGFAIALLSKETAVMIPPSLVAYVLVVRKRPQALRDVRLWLGWGSLLLGWYFSWSHAGAAGLSQTLGQRLGTVWSNLPVLLTHLGKTIVPAGLSVLANARDASPAIGAVLLLAGAAFVFWLSGRSRRLFVWGGLLFLFFALPTLAVSDFLILENRLYVPAVGIVISCLALAQGTEERWAPPPRPGSLAMATAILAVLSLKTWRYGESFRDAPSFTMQAVASSPHLALAHLNRGIVLHRAGQVTEAEIEYGTALSLDPQQPVTHNNLGLIYMNRGELHEAETALRREIAVNPEYDKAHFNLGLVLVRGGRLKEAIACWRQALALNPENAEARSNLERAQKALETGDLLAGASNVPSLTQAMANDIPQELIVPLFEQALKRDPENQRLRQAFADLCHKRHLSCAQAQER